MRKSEGVALRTDVEMQAAIRDLGQRLGTDNVSAIIRIGFMSGYKELNQLPEQLVRQSYREGVFQGISTFKARLETMISEVFSNG